MADEVKIDTGQGINLENLQTDYLYIIAGAGNINGYNISASRAKIDGGLGMLSLKCGSEECRFG